MGNNATSEGGEKGDADMKKKHDEESFSTLKQDRDMQL